MFEKPTLEIIEFPQEDIASFSQLPPGSEDLSPDDGEMDWD